MLDAVYCCGTEWNAKVYYLPYSKGRWKRLYFLDECPYCGNTVASLQRCDNDGKIKVLTRKVNKEALILRDKLMRYAIRDFKPKHGSYMNEFIFYNDKGIIYNFNDYRVGKNEDFCNNKLIEISG